MAAGIGAGVWAGPEALLAAEAQAAASSSSAAARIERTFAPAIGDAERAARGAKWARAVLCSLSWA